ncbi:MAG: PKD domain-containing protein [Bacteroidia bacterium]|nr:PKD domain-containing protein [Bacteroidia bacterium]
MKRIVTRLLLSTFIFCCTTIVVAQKKSFSSSTCDIYMDQSPLTRATGSGEENILNGLYSGLAQRYNNMNGLIKSVRFWARVPSVLAVANTAKVFIYSVSVSTGLPATTLGQTTVTILPSDSLLQADAVFSTPVAVSSNIIISIEPFTPLTDNIWIKHNASLNGGDLKLNLVRQGTTWFNDLDNGDPSWDYDFLILPIKSATVTSGFTHLENNLTTTLTNTSSNANSYLWNFGDVNTSTQASPSHTYSLDGTYSVMLKAFGADANCYDSLSQSVTVSAVGVNEINRSRNADFTFQYESSGQTLLFESTINMNVHIFNILGIEMTALHLNESMKKRISIELFPNGIYFITSGTTAYKFYKN